MKLIDKLLAAGEEALKLAKAPFVRNRIERAINSAIDNAGDEILEIEARIQDNYNKPDTLVDNLSNVVAYRKRIQELNRTIEILKEERALLFEREV